jgi:hypothetical protein
MATIVLKGRDGEALYFDGEWFEKVPQKANSQREHISDFRQHICELKKATRKQPEYFTVTILCRFFHSINCDADQKLAIDAFFAAIDEARQSPTS